MKFLCLVEDEQGLLAELHSLADLLLQLSLRSSREGCESPAAAAAPDHGAGAEPGCGGSALAQPHARSLPPTRQDRTEHTKSKSK